MDRGVWRATVCRVTESFMTEMTEHARVKHLEQGVAGKECGGL